MGQAKRRKAEIDQLKAKTLGLKTKNFKPDAGLNTDTNKDWHYWVGIGDMIQTIHTVPCMRKGTDALTGEQDFEITVDCEILSEQGDKLPDHPDTYCGTFRFSESVFRDFVAKIRRTGMGIRLTGRPLPPEISDVAGERFSPIAITEVGSNNHPGPMMFFVSMPKGMMRLNSDEFADRLTEFADR